MATAKKAKADGLNVGAIQKIFAMLKTRHEEDGALIEELERLIGGGRGIGEMLQEFYAHWIALWPHGVYEFNFTKDAPHCKRYIRSMGLEELKHRAHRYLKCVDPYYASRRHPFAMFVATINTWAEGALAGAEDVDAAPVGCTHTPPCRSDQEHTQRRQRAMTEQRQ